VSTEVAAGLPRPVRVVNMYATRWRIIGVFPSAEKLELGDLTRYYDFYKDRLPRLVWRSDIEVGKVQFEKQRPDGTLSHAEVSLFALPAGQLVCAATFKFEADIFSVDRVKTGIAAVLEQCIQGHLLVDGQPLSDYVDERVRGLSAELESTDSVELKSTEDAGLLPERHLLVFVPRLTADEGPPGSDVIEETVYRDAPPFREEFTRLQMPDQLNQTGRTLGAVTPYVSLLFGHERFVEDSVFLSTVQALGTASRFRQIWHEAYRQVQHFRLKNQRERPGEQTRDELESLADNLGNLEFDLTFSVEFPLIRIESFHSALFEALDLPTQTHTLSQMFAQLSGSVRSEITAIEIRERRLELHRQRWYAAAASIISLIAVPIGFIVAFFGVNASQVEPTASIFNMHRYMWVYAFALGLALIPAILIIYPYLRRDRKADNGLDTMRS
jgi:hypothetical protein